VVEKEEAQLTQRDTIADEEIDLRKYLLVLVRKWWVVLIVLVITTGAAVVLSRLQPEEFQTQTQLLIVARISERLISERSNPGESKSDTIPAVGISLSVETLRNLAKANDLLADIIRDLDLRNEVTGRYIAVESLAGIMDAKAEVTQGGTQEAPIPLLTMRVRGEDPALLKRIADKWADLFIQRNAQLFAAETARSFEFISSQYEETRKALQAKQEAKLAYQKANPLTSLQSQLEVSTASYTGFFSQLQANRAALADAQARLAYFDKTLAALRQRRAEKVAFQRANPLAAVQTDLEVLTARHRDFLSALQQKQAALVEAKARVQSLSTTLSAEPRLLSLKKSIPNESLFTLLGGNLTPDKLKALESLQVTSEEPNPIYLGLKTQLDQAQTVVSTYSAEIQDLGPRASELKQQIEQVAARIADITLKVSEFDEDIAIMSSGVDGDVGKEGALAAIVATARADVSLLSSTISDLEKRTAEFDNNIQRLSERIGQVQIDLARFDREASVLTTNFNLLAQNLQEARIAKEEQAGSIRVVEAAVVPQVPVGANRLRNIVSSAVLGLFLGVVVAFLVHYVQGDRPQAEVVPVV
jgi:uncharacterized protein involved in exopolysaccharide biosynthesis